MSPREARESIAEMAGLCRDEKLGEGKRNSCNGGFRARGWVRTERSHRCLDANLCFGILTEQSVSHLSQISLGPDTLLRT